MAVFYKYQYTNKRKNIHPCNLTKPANYQQKKERLLLSTLLALPLSRMFLTSMNLKETRKSLFFRGKVIWDI